jgi:hypothetical protein
MTPRAAKVDEAAAQSLGARASALPPSFCSARNFTPAPVAPAILSPVTLPTALRRIGASRQCVHSEPFVPS